jgi:hypothetical protein
LSHFILIREMSGRRLQAEGLKSGGVSLSGRRLQAEGLKSGGVSQLSGRRLHSDSYVVGFLIKKLFLNLRM